MKISGKIWAVCMLLACGCLWSAGNVAAKVCFVGDPDCAGGADFGDYVDPAADGELCKKEGYTPKDVCQADMTKHIVGYCPYNANYVMCCGREYAYDACVYPLVNDGKCGTRYKCACDSKKFKFKQQSASICKNVVNGTQYQNSIASGASCVYTGFSGGQSTVVSQFTECLCDRGLYPKTTEECSSIGSAAAGNSCTDSNGNVYYSTCLCGDDYKVISSECKYGTDARQKLCQQGDVYKARACCDCNNGTYPYDNIDDVDSADSPVATYASCEKEKFCTRGSRYRATSCKLGYKIVNGKCEPKECGEILEDYISAHSITGYALYKTGITPTAKNVIVAKDTGYGAKWENFYNKKVISATVYAQTIYGSDTLTKLVKQQCVETPKIEIGGIAMKSTSPLDFTSVILRSSSSWWNQGGFTCTNCGIEAFHYYNENKTELKYDPNLPNANNMYVKYTGATITADYISKGYNYEIGSLDFKVSNSFDKRIIIEGVSDTKRIDFKTNYNLIVRGLMMFNYANVYVRNTYVGINHVGSCGKQNHVIGSAINTYNTNWYLYDQGTINNVYVASYCMLGAPDSKGEPGISSSSNTKIITASKTYRGIVARGGQYKGGCCDDNKCNVRYITSYGTISSFSRTYFYCWSRGKSHSLNCGDTVRKYTGNGTLSKASGCCKESNSGSGFHLFE